jgi:protein-disulfide isomerase
VSKSKSRRRSNRATQSAPPRSAPPGPGKTAAAGRTPSRGARTRRSASYAAIGAVGLAALAGTVVLIALGGGVPSPNGLMRASALGGTTAMADSTTGGTAVPGTATASDGETPADPTLAIPTSPYEKGSPEAYASLVTCAGRPCPSLGAEDAPVTIVEISDFLCSHCRDFNQESARAVEERFVTSGQVRLVSHVFGFYDESQLISEAAYCAHEQGLYFEFQSEAFRNQSGQPPTSEDILSWASAVGVESEAFEACVSDRRYRDDVTYSTAEAQQAGITGTPSFLVNGELIEGNPPLDMLSAQIEAALAAAGGSS